MRLPKISIITPSFNQGKFIEQTILSVLRQGYKDLEYIIIDGGSSDNTLEIIKKYEKEISFWKSAPDRGQTDAIAQGFSRATGDLIAYINSDDVYFPGAFDSISRLYAADPDAAIYAGGMAIGNTTGVIQKCSVPGNIPRLFGRKGLTGFGQPSSFFNRKYYQRTEGMDIGLYMRMDADLMYKLLEQRYKTAVTSAMVSYFRWHPASKSTVSNDKYRVECAEFDEKLGVSPFVRKVNTLLFKLYRIVSFGYVRSLIATVRYRTINISEIWKGVL